MKRTIYLKALLLSVMIAFFGIANATNYYVDASTTASSQNGSLLTPWKSISQVTSNMNLFMPGDIISFKKGESYSGQLNFARSGTAGNPIIINSYGAGAAPKFIGTGNSIVSLFYLLNRSYVTFDGLDITDPSLSATDRSQQSKIERVFYIDGTSNNIIVKNCSISLAGVGFYLVGPNNTIDNCKISNMRMVVNTNNGGYDDYGANGVVVSSANNTITNNTISDCWANSYDFTYDGGAIEFFGANTNNNLIGYNTMFNNNGLTEFGSNNGGTSSGNKFVYNKLINNAGLFYINNSGPFAITVSNLQFYNNVVIETAVQRLVENYMLSMASASSNAGIVSLKNNIFWLTTGIDVGKSSMFTGAQLVHENNIYKLGTASVLNFTQTSSEITTTATNIFTNSTAVDPMQWDYLPGSNSSAIRFGQNLGIVKDFAGNMVASVPNAGILENAGVTSPLTVTATPGNISCNGGSTMVTVSASGGTPPYTGTGSFSVVAGSYTYTVNDANGLIQAASVVVTQPTSITVSVNAGSVLSYGGVTNITVSATGGTGAYSYKVNNGAYQSSNLFNGLSAGNYTITVKDANQCTATKTITINQPESKFSVTATAGNISCNGGSTIVAVSASGGTPPYTGTGSFSVIAGSYTYTVNDANGLIQSASVVVTQPTAITVTVNAGSVLSYGGVTNITVSAAGGTEVYSYRLDNGAYQSSNLFNGVSAGSYTVTVKDANQCTATKTITINQPTLSPLVINTSSGTISCYGESTTVTIGASGGLLPYTGVGTFTVYAGVNTFIVSDASGLMQTVTITIAQPTEISVNIIQSISNNNQSNQTNITVVASGGSGNYTYSLDGGSSQIRPIFRSVKPGNHIMTVKDSNGCTKSISFTVKKKKHHNHFAISLKNKKDVSCKGASDGEFELIENGGESPFTYTIQNTDKKISNKLTNLYPGVYNVIGTDANNEKDTITVEILNSNYTCETIGKGNSIKISTYPNPSAGAFSLTLETESNEDAYVEVLDLFGKKLFQTRMLHNQKISFGTELRPGSYFVRLVQGQKTISQKIIKL